MKNIVITSCKEVSAITIEGNLFPVDAGKKAKISHPISIPKWMEEGLEKKLFFEGTYESQKVGLTQKDDRIWLVSFMKYDLGYFDEESCRVEPIDNPFDSKVLPMCPV